MKYLVVYKSDETEGGVEFNWFKTKDETIQFIENNNPFDKLIFTVSNGELKRIKEFKRVELIN